MVKNLPAKRETRVRSLDWEDPQEKEMAPHSSILAWRIPWTEEPDRLQSVGSQRVRHNWTTNTFTTWLTGQTIQLYDLLYFSNHHEYSGIPVKKASITYSFLQNVIFKILNLIEIAWVFKIFLSEYSSPMDRGAWWATVHGGRGHKRVRHDLATKPQQRSWFTMLW